uniref:G_PROTEIN_RECEP_F1_2 domain-containing protein n=1 Tax=Rhabditophanes sp. KR3021 TaxID=114890 RepID=A0AC35U8P1_9BILA
MPNLTENVMSEDNITIEYYRIFMEPFESQKLFEKYTMIVVLTLFSLIIVIGSLGNLLVILTALQRRMRNSTNTLIIGLACSDLMFLTLCVPITAIEYVFPVWILPVWTCKLVYYLQHATAYFSVWTLTLMAGDRFLAVCFPVGSMSIRNSKNATMALMIMYTVILLSQIHVAAGHNIYHYFFIIENRSTCAMEKIAMGTATVFETRFYYFSFNIFGYLLPLGITCILYFCMLRRLWHSSRPGGYKQPEYNKDGCPRLTNKSESTRAKRKATKLISIVVVIWAVCWLPFNFVSTLSGIVYPQTLAQVWGKFATVGTIAAQVLAYANSCLNPILYALISESYRKGFITIIVFILKKCGISPWQCCLSHLAEASTVDASFHRDRSHYLNANCKAKPSNSVSAKTSSIRN